MKNVAIITASGVGNRFDYPTPKQYIRLADHDIVLAKSIKVFARNSSIDKILIVIRQEDKLLYENLLDELRISLKDNFAKLLPAVYGGARRQDSIRLGLESLASLSPTNVLIHDAARPFIDDDFIALICQKLEEYPAILPANQATDSLKLVENSKVTHLDRSKIYAATTPQSFRYELILRLHQKYQHLDVTDDVELLGTENLPVHIIASPPNNFKLTYPADLTRGNMMLTQNFEYRTGMGFDAHKFIENTNSHVMLCGIKIPHTASLAAHSDGDVALHALVDAILGAIAAGDIGRHFPPSDSKWKNVDSSIFVKHALDLLTQQKGQIVNVDITIICEQPKITPHSQAMREKLAEILNLPTPRISVKATTTEKMGFTGRKEGIAVQAVVTVKLPVDP